MHGPRSSRAVPNPHTGAFRVFVRSAALVQARRPQDRRPPVEVEP